MILLGFSILHITSVMFQNNQRNNQETTTEASTETTTEEIKIERFERLNDRTGLGYNSDYLRDKITDIIYLSYDGGTTPIYNKDGSFLTYEQYKKEEPEN